MEELGLDSSVSGYGKWRAFVKTVMTPWIQQKAGSSLFR